MRRPAHLQQDGARFLRWADHKEHFGGAFGERIRAVIGATQ
jgi:hypothetical protein